MTLILRKYEHGLSLEKPAPDYWRFSEFWVANARDEGTLEINEGILTVHLREGDLVYTVLEEPGVHEDASDPAGYRLTHDYYCQLVEQPPTHTG